MLPSPTTKILPKISINFHIQTFHTINQAILVNIALAALPINTQLHNNFGWKIVDLLYKYR